MKLQTERLFLRPFRLDDSGFIIRLLNTDGWLKFIGDRNVRTIADAENYLKKGPLKSYDENGFGLSAVVLRETGELIGMCGLIKREGLNNIDLGFAFLPEFEGFGYAFEISNACLRYAFNTLPVKKIIAITLPDNTGSVRLLEKLGMTSNGTIRLPHDTEDLLLYATRERSMHRPPFTTFPEFKTSKLMLREIRTEEADQLLEILFYNQKQASTTEEAKKILDKTDLNYRSGSGINWGIIDQKSAEIAGTIGYYRGFHKDCGEIGFVMKEKFRRQGFIKSSLELLIPFGFDTMKLNRIFAYTNPDNLPSQKTLYSAGFRQTGIRKDKYLEFEFIRK